MRRLLANPAARLSLLYAALSALWILLSDRVLELFLPEPQAFARAETYKGWVFVCATAALLYALVTRELARRRWTETMLSGQNRALEAIAGGAPLAPVLDGITDFMAQQTGCGCAIHPLATEEQRLSAAAAAGLPEAYRTETAGIPFAGWEEQARAVAAAHGLHLCWSAPITGSGGALLGALAAYAPEPGEPAARVRTLLAKAADVAAIALQRAREEQQLRLMQAVVQQIDEGVMITTAAQETESPRVVFVNDGWQRLAQTPVAEVLGQPAVPWVQLRAGAGEVSAALSQVAAGRSFAGDTSVNRPNGTSAVIEWTVVPLRDAAGTITHYVSVQRDATERRKAATTLERYRLLSDSTRTIVMFVRLHDGQIVDANQAAVAAYGYTQAELTTMRVSALRADGAPTPEAQEMIRTGAGGFTTEALHRRKDGSTFPTLSTVSMARVGGDLLCLTIVQDMTDVRRHQAIQELLHEIDHLILQKQPLDRILQYTCDQVSALFGYHLTWIGLKEADGTVRPAAVAGRETDVLRHIETRWAPESSGPTGEAVRSGRVQLAPLGAVPVVAGNPEVASRLGDDVALALPLTAEGETVGALSLYHNGEAPFDDETVRHLKQFANQVALSILAARAQEQIWLQTAALEAAANSILIADRTGRILWVNRAWSRLTGYAATDAVGTMLEAPVVDGRPRRGARWNWDELLAGRPWTISKDALRKDGGQIYLDETVTPLCDGAGNVSHVIAIGQDVTERHKHEEHLRYLALHDPMTGLPNRRALQERLQEMVGHCSPERKGALLLLDLDHFKLVNDAVGDTGGDEVLLRVAELLQRTLRSGDLLTRFGGDQFAVLLNPITPEAARARADSFRLALSERRFRWEGKELNISISLGIAMIDGSMDGPGVKALADLALAAAKEAGRNQVVLFQSERDRATSLAEENRLAAMIKEALGEKRFRLYFQPVVRLISGEVDHYEALIRLAQPDGTVMSPGAFLGAAERFRLMPAIDRWVLEETIRVLESRPDLRICMNLSGQSLSDASLLSFTEARLRQSAGVAERLSFEITETVAVTDIDRLALWMERLQQLGCIFALDDFGIGFCSFAYLRNLPADYIKIDGSFIKNLDTDPANRSLVEAMSSAAHTLGKRVVAEWVENDEIARILEDVGIEYGQGYKWGKPLPEIP